MGRGNGKLGQSAGSMRGVAADELRRHNLGAVLDHLHLAGPVTRSQLTVVTGLNRSTVADLIGELAALGLVTEGPATVANGPGRPSPVVDVRPHGAVVLAVEISVDSLAVATVGIGGHVFNQVRVARHRGHFRPDQTIADIGQLSAPLLDALPEGSHVLGAAAAIVGIARRSDGFVHFGPNLGWRDVPLGDMLATGLGLPAPVAVANDADLGALGEFRRGGRPDVEHLVYISGEVGIGCGVIAGGSPLLGSAGYAGEAGHNLVNPNGTECGCGATGCWETEAGEKALLARAGLAGEAVGLEALDLLEDRTIAGDRQALEAMEETGHWLGIGIRTLINLFNPEVVVLGGMYHRFFDHLIDSAIRSTSGAVDVSRSMAEISRSNIGLGAPLIGAAELVLAGVIDDPAAVLHSG
ncbi:MAG: ROK family transcriptional regulator [Acidimicrobiia bacterium]|nr:ROK family transcriptional regulator [Acidimicrobiia bacterium]